jgi:hypothetical protein
MPPGLAPGGFFCFDPHHPSKSSIMAARIVRDAGGRFQLHVHQELDPQYVSQTAERAPTFCMGNFPNHARSSIGAGYVVV